MGRDGFWALFPEEIGAGWWRGTWFRVAEAGCSRSCFIPARAALDRAAPGRITRERSATRDSAKQQRVDPVIMTIPLRN